MPTERFVVDTEGDEGRTQTENVGKIHPSVLGGENLVRNIHADFWKHPDILILKTFQRFHLFNLLSFKLHHVHLQFAMPTTSASSGVGNVEPKY